MKTKTTSPYENNPFMIGIEGLKLTFSHAKSVGIYSIVVSASLFVIYLIVSIISTIIDSFADNQSSPEQFTIVSPSELIVTLVGVFLGIVLYLVVTLLLFGVLEHAAATIAKGEKTTLKQSFLAVLRNFPAYLWLYILIIVKVFLWSLLFIVPGIIMMNRYLLAGTVFFAENKRGNQAIKRSSELVKNAWLTTYGGAWAWNLVSQGLATFVFWPGCMAVLYRQLSLVTDKQETKPSAHIFSWLILLVPISLALLFTLCVVLLAALIALAGA